MRHNKIVGNLSYLKEGKSALRTAIEFVLGFATIIFIIASLEAFGRCGSIKLW